MDSTKRVELEPGLPLDPAAAAVLAERLEVALDELARGRGIRHALLAAESSSGGFRWAGSRGDARPGGPALTTETPYYIASIDKLFTAVVTLRLHERGRLDVEAPIGEYLDGSLVEGIHRWRGSDLSPNIAVRNLLAHTSGLANFLEDRPKGGRTLIEKLSVEGDRAWTIEDVTRSLREELEPHFPPQDSGGGRQRIRYSDSNYALLHAIVEAVTGAPLHEVFETELFAPLGLDGTWMAGFPRAGSRPDEVATLWVEDRPLEIPLAMSSLHGIFSHANDQLRFMHAFANGELFESPRTKELMQARWNRFGLPLDRAALRAPSWPIEYGLGVKRFRLPRILSGPKPMPALYGHSGSTGTWAFHCPALGVSIVGTVDQVTAGAVPYRFLPKVVNLIQR